MTIRKIWLFILMFMALVSVIINAVILTSLTDRYFIEYRNENYTAHMNEITSYIQNSLIREDLSLDQMAMVLETHLDDPIIRIKLYDYEGKLLIDTQDSPMMGGMMDMMRNSYDDSDSEVDMIQIYDGEKLLGQLNIIRYSALENSIVARNFTSSLIKNSFYSFGAVMIVALIIGIFISRKMSRELYDTAVMAQEISIGSDPDNKDTGISEIKTIRQSLVELNNKLKLKNKSRKVLIDELIHQTRTPLTVLKTHLEGFTDNILEMTPDEIKVCENQIDDLTAIISNMGNLIDAGKDLDDLRVEEFEISSLLRQIINGLRAQFNKKQINLVFKEKNKITLQNDKYKLSQIIYNLLTNAFKYTKENGTVTLGYENSGESIVLFVEDNGTGIAEKDIAYIFEAYYRSNENASFRGEGLGLYLAKQNADQMHGIIEVQSKKGKGSKFKVTIPRVLEDTLHNK